MAFETLNYFKFNIIVLPLLKKIEILTLCIFLSRKTITVAILAQVNLTGWSKLCTYPSCQLRIKMASDKVIALKETVGTSVISDTSTITPPTSVDSDTTLVSADTLSSRYIRREPGSDYKRFEGSWPPAKRAQEERPPVAPWNCQTETEQSTAKPSPWKPKHLRMMDQGTYHKTNSVSIAKSSPEKSKQLCRADQSTNWRETNRHVIAKSFPYGKPMYLPVPSMADQSANWRKTNHQAITKPFPCGKPMYLPIPSMADQSTNWRED
jgi:hypothetical protein